MSKIIAIYGSPGSGRSTLAAAISANIAKRRQNVIMLSTNRIVPMLKVLAPTQKINKSVSVGGLFVIDTITQDAVCKRIVFHPKCPSLGFMGLASGDTPNTYNNVYHTERIRTIYNILLNLADVIIVDCMSAISPGSDPLGATAMMNSGLIIKLLTPDVASVEYNNAVFPLLSNLTGKEQITVLGKCSMKHPVRETIAMLNEDVQFFLPFSEKIDSHFRSGQLIEGIMSGNGREYLSVVEKLAKEVEACQS